MRFIDHNFTSNIQNRLNSIIRRKNTYSQRVHLLRGYYDRQSVLNVVIGQKPCCFDNIVIQQFIAFDESPVLFWCWETRQNAGAK